MWIQEFLGVTKTWNGKRNGMENGMKRKICYAIYIYLRNTNTLSLYESPVFPTDNVDLFYIHHKIVLSYLRVKEI